MPRHKLLLALFISGCCLSLQPAAKSFKVAIIGGAAVDPQCRTGANVVYNGGCLPVTGPAGELGDYQFSGMSVGSVNAATLAPYDTVVLLVSSFDMHCDLTTLSSASRADLIAWAGQGHKLIIYDSECQGTGTSKSLDYSWLPFPFTTANPGQAGSSGTLTIVENSTLGSNVSGSPYFLDSADLSANAEVGDANVMTSKDAHWCVALVDRNILNVTGPVHTYAKYPPLTDNGLIIYNGFDQDQQGPGGNANMRKIWLFELQQPFNPSFLPCGVAVAGITLTPTNATHPPGTSYTVTATLKDQSGNPQVNVAVTFSVTAGPNQGATGACSPGNCATGANGQVSFTYTDPPGRTGTDTIQACFTPAGSTPVCITASETWAITACDPNAVLTLTTASVFGSPPSSVEVAVGLSQTPQPPCASSLQFDTAFDLAKLTFVSARKGEALTAVSKDITTQVAAGVVTINGSGPNQNTIGNGNVAYLTFNMTPNFTAGSTPLVMGRCLGYDINSVPLTTNCINGSVTFACTCDTNKDGAVNVLDLQLMVNQVLGVSPASCDLNRDGLINVQDIQVNINGALGLGCK